MKVLLSTAVALVCMSGALAPLSAQAQGRPPWEQDDRREKIERLENEIRELEGALKRDDLSDERRGALKERLGERRTALKELLASRPPGTDERRKAHQERMRQVEIEIGELEAALKNKEAAPEQRKKLMGQLENARSELEKLRAAANPPAGAGQYGPPGPTPDLEWHKLYMEAQELERASMDLANKLRGIPKDKEADRSEVLEKLKDVVTKLFDVREKSRAREIELIKKRLEELTRMLDKRKENRDSIIEKRIKQLSGESDPLDW